MTISESALEGIQRAESKVDSIARKVALQTTSNNQVADSVDLSDVAVKLIQARNEVAVNVKTLQTADDMAKTILNILA